MDQARDTMVRALDNIQAHDLKKAATRIQRKALIYSQKYGIIGDKHLGYGMFLKLIDEAETKGYEKIVIASANRVAATPEKIKAIKEHLEGKKVHIETKDGTIVLFDYADADESPKDMSFGLTIM